VEREECEISDFSNSRVFFGNLIYVMLQE